MIDPLDFDLTLDIRKNAVIRYCDGKDEVSVDLLELVRSAADPMTVEQMETLCLRLDEISIVALRLVREMSND